MIIELFPVILLILVLLLGYKSIFSKNNDQKKNTQTEKEFRQASDAEIKDFLNKSKTVIADTDIFLEKDEHPILSLNNVYLFKKQTIKTKGSYEGISVNVMSGVGYRLGGFKAKPEIRLVKVDEGNMLVSSKKVFFHGSNQSHILDLKNIISVKKINDGLVIHQTKKSEVLSFMNIENSWREMILNSNNSFSSDILNNGIGNLSHILKITIGADKNE